MGLGRARVGSAVMRAVSIARPVAELLVEATVWRYAPRSRGRSIAGPMVRKAHRGYEQALGYAFVPESEDDERTGKKANTPARATLRPIERPSRRRRGLSLFGEARAIKLRSPMKLIGSGIRGSSRRRGAVMRSPRGGGFFEGNDFIGQLCGHQECSWRRNDCGGGRTV